MDREKQDWQEWERNLDGFTQRVDGLIKKSGKTQKQIAAELGMTQSTFSRWKHADRKGMSACFHLEDGEGPGHIGGLSPFRTVSNLNAPPSSSGP